METLFITSKQQEHGWSFIGFAVTLMALLYEFKSRNPMAPPLVPPFLFPISRESAATSSPTEDPSQPQVSPHVGPAAFTIPIRSLSHTPSPSPSPDSPLAPTQACRSSPLFVRVNGENKLSVVLA